MTTEESFPVDYSKQIAIVAALRRGFEKGKHHARFTKRLRPYFEAELPGYTIYLESDSSTFGFSRVHVHGNGLDYSEAVRLSWVTCDDWQDAFAKELDRNDYSDYAERQEDEISLVVELNEIHRQVEGLRHKADRLIAGLPKPKSAKIRTWEDASASSALCAVFPLLFKR